MTPAEYAARIIELERELQAAQQQLHRTSQELGEVRDELTRLRPTARKYTILTDDGIVFNGESLNVANEAFLEHENDTGGATLLCDGIPMRQYPAK